MFMTNFLEMKILDACEFEINPREKLSGFGEARFDVYVWLDDSRFGAASQNRIMVLVEAHVLEVVTNLIEMQEASLLRFEIHAQDRCVYIWNKEDDPESFLSFATERQLRFTKEIVLPYVDKYGWSEEFKRAVEIVFPDQSSDFDFTAVNLEEHGIRHVNPMLEK